MTKDERRACAFQYLAAESRHFQNCIGRFTMNRAFRASVMLATSVVWIAWPLRANVVGCGIIAEESCPGCSPHTPSDSTCACGENGSSCDCIKNSGGRQTEQIVTCAVGDFGFIYKKHQSNIEEGGWDLCYTVQQCQNAQGAQADCGTPTVPPGGCELPPWGGCHWVQIAAPQARLLTTNGGCP